jgi:hypothetical protein
MALLTRNHYVSLLTKLAEESSVPEVDNQQIAHGELSHNLGDQRETLKGLFTNFASAQKHHTSEVKKALPRGEKDVSSPLLKMASWPYIQTMNRSFLDELEKIGYRDVMTSAPTDVGIHRPKLTGQHLDEFRRMTGSGGAQAATAGAGTQAARFGAEHGLAPAVAARRAALAAKGPGVLARMGKGLSKVFRAAA